MIRSPSKRRQPSSSLGSQCSSRPSTSLQNSEPIEPVRKSPRTPPKQHPRDSSIARIVTPSSSSVGHEKKHEKEEIIPINPRRSLLLSPIFDEETENQECNADSTTDHDDDSEVTEVTEHPEPTKHAVVVRSITGPRNRRKKKLPFGGRGRTTKSITIPKNVQTVYQIIHRHSGSIGGNGHGGAIYGELTVGSMQKMTNLMVEHTGLSDESRFIDVGCGLGKPNLHVAQYPGVGFSYGIEMEEVRWMLGISNLNSVLREAMMMEREEGSESENESDESDDSKVEIGHRCYLAHGDITEAKYFDPFTHVYMFDIGFPPRLFHQLADMFNRSKSEYLICYHGPKLMIDTYEFNVELIIQTPTSMHGSCEVHTGYIYRRAETRGRKAKPCKSKCFGVPCDPLFSKAWQLCMSGIEAVSEHTASEVSKHFGKTKRRTTRSSRKKLTDDNTNDN